jgi:C1A family cysteine protease
MKDLYLILTMTPPIVIVIMFVLFGMIIIFFILIFILAFKQGRSISFWPPNIGARVIQSEKLKIDKEVDPVIQEIESIEMPGSKENVRTGWLMPTPDPNDLTENDRQIISLIKRLDFPSNNNQNFVLPDNVDLRDWCPEIKNQGKINSSTAHAATSMLEYFECRVHGSFIDFSRRFLYGRARELMFLKGDSGASIRSTLEAIRVFGIPPEKYWPYIDEQPDFDNDPPTSAFAIAYNFEAMSYFCHDPSHISIPTDLVLFNVKKFLAAGIPSIFGFFIFPSFSKVNIKGGFPYPCKGEKYKWRHASLAVGYDDNKKIENLKCKTETSGALLIHNSWGTNWGDSGYGWLPYEYVLKKQALDFWSILRGEWIYSKVFGFKP